MSHWQQVEERLFTLCSGRGVVFARCACRRCKISRPGWLLEAEDARPLSATEEAEAWALLEERSND